MIKAKSYTCLFKYAFQYNLMSFLSSQNKQESVCEFFFFMKLNLIKETTNILDKSF